MIRVAAMPAGVAHMPHPARSRRVYDDRSAYGRRNVGDAIGPAIREGEPFTDNFTKCELKWARLMTGATFMDVPKPRF